MASMTKTLVRGAVIGTVGIGLLAFVIGPDRMSAFFRQAQDSINKKIDENITDPVALRQQLRDLEGQYPKKIAAVRSDLSEVRSQIAGLKREKDVSVRVVELAEADLNTLKNLVARAEDARAMNAALSEPKRIEIAFQDKVLAVEDAYAKAQDVANTRGAYTARVGEIERDLDYLAKQENRLAGMLTKLEGERQEFQVQLWQLDRQVDSIARNDRMIDMLSKSQKTIDEHSRYKASSLDHLTDRVAEIRAKQEGELASLAAGETRSDYESRARTTMSKDAARESLRGATGATAKKEATLRISAQPGDDKAPPPPSGLNPSNEPAKGQPTKEKPSTQAEAKPGDGQTGA